MIKERGPGRGFMITGSGAHNRKIDSVIGLYYELFSFMEENAILDPFNEVDIAAFHYSSIPTINEKLEAWQHAQSKHCVQTIKSSPLHLWVAGPINCPLDDMSIDQLRTFEVEGILTNEEVDE